MSNDEERPLLSNGHSDDATKTPKSLAYNVLTKTALIAQVGALLLAGSVFLGVFTHPMIFMSSHPLLNSAGIVFVVQAILIVQPTETAQQKRKGALLHSGLNTLAATALFSALIIIEVNKGNGARFKSLHGKLGLTTYICIFVQLCIGITMYYAQWLYGGEENAKSVWKYHRISGYLVLVSLLGAATSATLTPYIKDTVKISIWPVLAGSVLILAGILPRLKAQKLGF